MTAELLGLVAADESAGQGLAWFLLFVGLALAATVLMLAGERRRR